MCMVTSSVWTREVSRLPGASVFAAVVSKSKSKSKSFFYISRFSFFFFLDLKKGKTDGGSLWAKSVELYATRS